MKKELIINGEKTFVSSKTLFKILEEINITINSNIAIAVNDKVIEKIFWKKYKIKSGDMIEIVHPLKGG